MIEVKQLRIEPVPLIIADVFEHFNEQMGGVGLLGSIGLDAFILDLDYSAEQVRVSENPLSELQSDVIPLPPPIPRRNSSPPSSSAASGST